jgi:sulfur carrier protein
MIEIQLNGETHKIEENLSVEELLKKLSIDKNKVAVELNQTVVSKQTYSNTTVVNKDVVEIVTFIGGG